MFIFPILFHAQLMLSLFTCYCAEEKEKVLFKIILCLRDLLVFGNCLALTEHKVCSLYVLIALILSLLLFRLLFSSNVAIP